MATHPLEALRAALAQQRTYEAENWPFVGEQNEPTGSGESITYHLASLYCWDPEYVLKLPEQERKERLKEIWRSFAIAGDIIKRYEDATVALLADPSITSAATSYQAMETALQLLTGNILNLRTELLVVKGLLAEKESEE